MGLSTDQEFLMELGKRIVAARKGKGFSQADLAYRIGMEKSNLSVIENGKSNPQILTLVKIASCLEIDMKTLVSFTFDYDAFKDSINVYQPRKHRKTEG
jgi:transcriptional regulator with XRE-family HTH domain